MAVVINVLPVERPGDSFILLRSWFWLIAVLVITGGCAPNIAYRTDYQPCVSARPAEQCRSASLQEYADPANPELAYTLGFVEFDDQGQLHDRRQMAALLDYLYEQASRNALLINVFVHGWHHNAAPGDDNIANFRDSLLKLSKLERVDARMSGRAPRRVVGVYVGWRGESWEIPVLNTLTFWDRKATAQKVGHGGITEFFSKLEQLRDVADNLRDGTDDVQSRLVVLGHSFGGAVVYSALSQILMERFVGTLGPAGISSSVRGFADLTILINPAFEAMQFTALSDMANERGSYFADQPPVLVVLTSEADWATKYAFRLGRVFSTLLDKHRETVRVNRATGEDQRIGQWGADTTAVGHFKPYITHELVPDETLNGADIETIMKAVRRGWKDDGPGVSAMFPGTRLKHLDKSIGRNPYLNVTVDNNIIPDHNDIYDRRVIDFLAYLIMFSTAPD